MQLPNWLRFKQAKNPQQKSHEAIVKILNSLAPKAKTTIDAYTSTIFACVNKIASQMQEIDPYLAYEVETDVFEYQPAHWFNRLIKMPNRYNFTFESFVSQMLYQYFGKGNVIIHALPTQNKKEISELVILNSSKIQIEFNSLGNPHYYIFNQVVQIPATQIIHIKDLANSDESFYQQYFWGTPTYLNASAELVATQTEILAYYDRLLRADGKDVLAIKSSSNIQESALEALGNRLKKIYGDDLAKNFLALESGLDITPIKRSTGFASALLGSNPQEQLTRSISSIFNIPYPVFNGEFSGVTNNSSIMLNKYYRSINTLYYQFTSAITNHLQLYYDPKAVMYFDDLVYESAEEQDKKLTSMFARGQISRNELNRIQGLPEIDGGDDYFIANNYRSVNSAGEIIQNSIIATKQKSNMYFESERYALWKSLDEPFEQEQPKISRSLSKVFAELFDSILNDLDINLDYLGVLNKEGISSNFDFFDVEKFKALIQDSTLTARERAVISAVVKQLEIIGEGNLDSESINRRFRNEIKLALQKNGIRLSQSIDTLQRKIVNLINTSIINSAGLSKVEIKQNIEQAIKEYSKEYTKESNLKETRLEMIARTITSNLVNETYYNVQKKLGFGSEWITQRDSEVRASHEAMDGKVVFEGEPFVVGGDMMHYPAGGSIAEENINCRCRIKAVRKKENQIEVI